MRASLLAKAAANKFGCSAPASNGSQSAWGLVRRKHRLAYLMRKSSLVSLVPFISSRIQTGVMPRPDHFTDLFFLL